MIAKLRRVRRVKGHITDKRPNLPSSLAWHMAFVGVFGAADVLDEDDVEAGT